MADRSRAHTAIADIGRVFPAFIMAASAIVLGSALVLQHWGGLAPCELCLFQRWPWAIATTIGLVGTMVGSRPVLPWLALVLALVFLAGTALGVYHVAVEQHWIEGPARCTGSLAAGSIEELRARLMGQDVVRCDQPSGVFLGISLAGWNALASLAMAAICLAVYARCRGARRVSRPRRAA